MRLHESVNTYTYIYVYIYMYISPEQIAQAAGNEQSEARVESVRSSKETESHGSLKAETGLVP